MGWPAPKPRRDLVPALFDTVDVELDDVDLPRVLAAVGEHVAVPILVDSRGAVPTRKSTWRVSRVSLPAKRTMYEIVLRKVLVPQKLSHEVRVDEATEAVYMDLDGARKVSLVENAGGGAMILPAEDVVARSNRWA